MLPWVLSLRLLAVGRGPSWVMHGETILGVQVSSRSHTPYVSRGIYVNVALGMPIQCSNLGRPLQTNVIPSSQNSVNPSFLLTPKQIWVYATGPGSLILQVGRKPQSSEIPSKSMKILTQAYCSNMRSLHRVTHPPPKKKHPTIQHQSGPSVITTPTNATARRCRAPGHLPRPYGAPCRREDPRHRRNSLATEVEHGGGTNWIQGDIQGKCGVVLRF